MANQNCGTCKNYIAQNGFITAPPLSAVFHPLWPGAQNVQNSGITCAMSTSSTLQESYSMTARGRLGCCGPGLAGQACAHTIEQGPTRTINRQRPALASWTIVAGCIPESHRTGRRASRMPSRRRICMHGSVVGQSLGL